MVERPVETSRVHASRSHVSSDRRACAGQHPSIFGV
jgi:hypothetical protein